MPNDDALSLSSNTETTSERVRTDAARVEALLAKGQNTEAMAIAEALVREIPADPLSWNVYGVVNRVLGRPAAAVAAYTRALEIAPRHGAALSNLGNAWRDLQRFDEAVACHRAALATGHATAARWANLGVALRDATRYEEALVAYDKSLELEPQNARTLVDRSQVLLMLGRYQAGWSDFEYRWQLPDFSPRLFSGTAWDGSPQPGKTLLLWPEQGFGDTILCSRFIKRARARVGRVVLMCQPELKRLFSSLPGIDQIIAKGEPVPPYELHSPLMGLPRFFVPSLHDIPGPLPLTVPDAARAKLAPPFAGTQKQFKVGIVWSGSLTFKNNRLRATTLERFIELAAVPNIRLFSLQKGPRSQDLANAGASGLITDLAPLMDDFADTAAAIENLDLVVMTDSSVAHLTGSLGRPVWNLLPRMPYWLYGPDGVNTPWYPSMRFFRQPDHGDWDSVFTRVKATLSVWEGFAPTRS